MSLASNKQLVNAGVVIPYFFSVVGNGSGGGDGLANFQLCVEQTNTMDRLSLMYASHKSYHSPKSAKHNAMAHRPSTMQADAIKSQYTEFNAMYGSADDYNS